MGLFGGESTIDEVETAELPAELDVDDFTPVEAVTSTLKGLFRGYTKYDDEYIVGEVGDLSKESDNLYFSITATHSDGTLNCVVWQSNREALDIDIE